MDEDGESDGSENEEEGIPEPAVDHAVLLSTSVLVNLLYSSISCPLALMDRAL